MSQQDNTAFADLERLAHWACRTLNADRLELRRLVDAWCGVSGLHIRHDVLAGVCDHVFELHRATRTGTTLAAA